LERWKAHTTEYSQLAKMARDIFSIRSISAEVERLFSSTKLMLPFTTNPLLPEPIQAGECLRFWIRLSLFKGITLITYQRSNRERGDTSEGRIRMYLEKDSIFKWQTGSPDTYIPCPSVTLAPITHGYSTTI
jgi:hypothetical protein